ncbi:PLASMODESMATA CALLOSE-BINDING PROTEIN 5 isoform X1 [Amborella trichopoda]|uniref:PLASMODESMATA CALLOSE-BINDING PROTEIN 5 isoform X1 n=1 Tax=Amborella trichopoda TaxID=13333 RepID=UPI0005D2F9A8|nr:PLASMODESMATA CALLOSE-BINDING PROTEIN 5 isoform X1 [Amborella trichopoda]|eukprot:XP_006852511.2 PLASMODESMATA CALLOSE-BINDING PROTEIN 5 isoform X1 [Amborella trichopoda]
MEMKHQGILFFVLFLSSSCNSVCFGKNKPLISVTITNHKILENGKRKLLGADDDATTGGGGGGGNIELWCVAKNNVGDGALQSALDWACGAGGADCGAIQQGGPCFEPNNVQAHASYSFNDYFLKHGMSTDSCDFSNTAALTSLNPSSGSCDFPSSLSAKNGSFSGGSSSGMEPAGLGLNGSSLQRDLAPLTFLSLSLTLPLLLFFPK